MLHGKALRVQEHILWASTFRVLSTAQHRRQMLSVLTWRIGSHLHDAHAMPYVVPNVVANQWDENNSALNDARGQLRAATWRACVRGARTRGIGARTRGIGAVES